jgi:hypothetical protein
MGNEMDATSGSPAPASGVGDGSLGSEVARPEGEADPVHASIATGWGQVGVE